MGGASKASQSDYAEAQIGVREGALIGRIAPARFQLEVMQKQNAPNPGEPGPMRFEQGLRPCQFIVRYWLPVF